MSTTKISLPRRLVVPLAFVLYAFAGVACFGRLPGSRALPGFGDDPESFVWFLLWWPWALLHGHNPLHAAIVFAPTGYGLSWATAVPTAAFLAWPITLLAGPVSAYGWLMLLAPACNGAAFAALAFEVTGNAAASVFAGFLFAFCGYIDGHILGHLNLALVFPLPLVALAAWRRVRGTLTARAFITTVTILLTAQFGLSTEIFADLVLFSALSIVVFAIPRTHRSQLVVLARDAALCLVLTVIMVSPFLIEMARDAPTIPDFLNSPAIYSNDLLNPVIPTSAQRLQTAWTFHLSERFTGNVTERDLYLGLPLTLILLLYALRRRPKAGRAQRVCLFVLFAVSVLLSFGPVLHIAGHPTILLPAVIFTHLPLLHGALPSRDALFAEFVASLIAALWWAERRMPLRLPLAIAAVTFLVPGQIGHAWTPASPPCLFTPGAFRAVLGVDPTILLLPYGDGRTMLWQAQSGMRFRQTGGRLSFVPVAWQADPLTFPLLRNEAPPPAEVAAFARRHGARAILAGPGTNPALIASLSAQAGARSVCGVVILPVSLLRSPS